MNCLMYIIKYKMTNRIPLAIYNRYCRYISSPFWKCINLFCAHYWQVKMGKKGKFLGKTIFRIMPGTTVSIGENCQFLSSHASNWIGVNRPCIISTIKEGANICIGDNCGFSGTSIGAALRIMIGDNVRFGANTLVTDSDWHYDDARSGPNAEVIIGDNVWVGYGTIILKGVHIGENSVIGAGSIVTSDIPANVIAAGNPCKVIKKYYEV